MKRFFIFVVTAISLLYQYLIAYGQESQLHILNTLNGLPSNHIYGMITDKYGYLWIYTDKGFVRYNGFEFKAFSLSNELPTNDVWELLEDRQGRIWLGCISDEIGYIKCNIYHRAVLKNWTGTIYPNHIRCFEDGIIFQSGSIQNNSICFERDDTIFSVNVNTLFPKSQFGVISNSKDAGTSDRIPLIVINEFGIPLCIYDKKIYSINLAKKTGEFTVVELSSISGRLVLNYSDFVNTSVGNNIVSFSKNHDARAIYLTNIHKGSVLKQTIDLPEKDSILSIYPEKKVKFNNEFYIITIKSVYRCTIEEQVRILDSLRIGDKPSGDPSHYRVAAVHNGTFWGLCLGTDAQGVLMLQKNRFKSFKKKDSSFANYLPVGAFNDSLTFWWNKSLLNLAVVSKGGTKYYTGKGFNNIRFVNHYNKDTFFVGAENPFFFILKSGIFVPLPRIDFGSGYLSSLPRKNDMLFATAFGLFSIRRSGDRYDRTGYDLERYNSLVFDSFRQNVIAYNTSTVSVLQKAIRKTFDKAKLASIGIRNLANVSVDHKYGNIFLKGYDNLFIYDPEEDIGKMLFKNLRIKDEATVLVYRNKLIIAWKYGILFSVITGKMQVSDPLVFLNTKCSKYKEIYGCALSGGKLQLNTDSGLFEIDVPETGEILKSIDSIPGNYKIVVQQEQTMRNISEQDTLYVLQSNRKLLFDYIFPYRNGPLIFQCSFSAAGELKALNANEVNIPDSFIPDSYHKLFISASDDSWKSNTLELNIYVVPYWWQTKSAIRLIWAGCVFIAFFIVFVVFFLTRKMVLKTAQKKQLQMEMELRSIYAQINPHFIFNSLNSALLLVSKNKMDDAYAHISKFSRLLRSYMKSSRNKYTTIGEEAENLRNYIELQQTRFKEKFVYELHIDNKIDQASQKIPSLLIQPFVENAINHGITQKSGTSVLKIEFIFAKEENEIICTIDDDGIGRRKSAENREYNENHRESYGNLMIKDLVSIFSKYEGLEIDIRYTDKSLPLTGTTVTITIKYPKK